MRASPILLALLCFACGARTGLGESSAQGGSGGSDREPSPPPSYCQDAGTLSIYVVSTESKLWSFDPPSREFTLVGSFSCPASSGATPNSMAVAHDGRAFVNFDTGELFEVNVVTAACKATGFVPNQQGFSTRFGSAFSADPSGANETYFVSSNDFATAGNPGKLGRIDLDTLTLTVVGEYTTFIGDAELTGTGDGRLYAFGLVSGNNDSFFAQLDPTDATVLSAFKVPIVKNDASSWAFSFWGGAFYFFTGVGSDSHVARLQLDGSPLDLQYAVLPGQRIVGAGVSTCAPQ